MNNKVIKIALALLLTMQIATAQSSYKLDNNRSIIKITGTSNVHDWEMEASGMTASLILEKDGDLSKKISSVGFSLPTKKIKSHNSIMDKKTWEAIKADKFNTIDFNFPDLMNFDVKGNQISGIAMGSLTIAGISNYVSVPFKGTFIDNKELTIEGIKEIILNEFNVEAPTAMMGTLKTGESVNVIFSLHFIAQ